MRDVEPSERTHASTFYPVTWTGTLKAPFYLLVVAQRPNEGHPGWILGWEMHARPQGVYHGAIPWLFRLSGKYKLTFAWITSRLLEAMAIFTYRNHRFSDNRFVPSPE